MEADANIPISRSDTSATINSNSNSASANDLHSHSHSRKASMVSNISKMWSRSSNLGLPNPVTTWTPKRRMSVMAVIIATIGSFGLGMTLVWSAPALKYLKEDFGDISTTQSSIIGSIIYLGALIAAPITGFLITTIGRKKTMLLTAIPCMLGWIIMAAAQNLWMIYLGRFITGYCGGSFTVSIPTYVSEVTEDKLRGTLGTVMILMLVTGIEFTFIVGAFVGWFWLTVVSAVVPLVFFVSMLFMPESPRYLLITRQATAARRALQWLRRASTVRHIEPEITQIQDSVDAHGEKVSTFADLLTPSVLKALGVSIGLMAFAQLSGMNGIALYTTDVFEKAGTEMDSRFAGIIIWGGQAISVLFVTFYLVERAGRRTLFISSLLVMTLGLIGFGLSFFLQEGEGTEAKVPRGLEWLPLTSLATFIIGYNIGMGPLPWLVTTEVLAPRVRELGSSVVTLFYWTLSFVAGVSFNSLEGAFGSVGLYWGHAGVCLLGVLFIVFLVPETKGKSPVEIEKWFGGPPAPHPHPQIHPSGNGVVLGVGLHSIDLEPSPSASSVSMSATPAKDLCSKFSESGGDGLGIRNPNFRDEDDIP